MAENFDMLATVKAALGISGNYQDATLNVYIAEVGHYMAAAGVPENVIGQPEAAGTVARGVSDLWNYGAGTGTLSPYFYERCIQLASVATDSGEGA